MRQRRSPGTGRRYPLTMICATYRLARSSVYAGRGRGAEADGQTGAEDRDQRRRVGDGDPRRPGGVSVSWGGLSQGARAARPPRLCRERQAGAAPDARARPAGPAPPGPAERQSGARWHDHHGSARRDVGHRWHAVLHRARGVVLVLRRDRSPSRRSRRLARGQARRSLGRAGADSPRRAPCLRAVRQGRGARLGAPVRLGAAVHRRRVDQRGEVARGARSRRPTSGSRSATGSRSASCARSRSSASTCISFAASRRRARSSPSSSPATTPSGSSSGSGIGRRRRRARMPNGGRHEPPGGPTVEKRGP